MNEGANRRSLKRIEFSVSYCHCQPNSPRNSIGDLRRRNLSEHDLQTSITRTETVGAKKPVLQKLSYLECHVTDGGVACPGPVLRHLPLLNDVALDGRTAVVARPRPLHRDRVAGRGKVPRLTGRARRVEGVLGLEMEMGIRLQFQ